MKAAMRTSLSESEATPTMSEARLQHVLVVLGYLGLLWISLLQATPRAGAHFGELWQAGDVRLQISAEAAPRSGQRIALTLTSPTLGGQFQLLDAALVAASPDGGSAGPVRRVPLALWREAPGVYQLGGPALLPGRWNLLIEVREARGAVSGAIPLRVENPPPPPAWLEWRMGLLTFALLVYALIVHNRRGSVYDHCSASAVACEDTLCQ